MKTGALSIRTFSIQAVMAVLALLSTAPSGARVESASVVVQGMSCPFCAFGVEKRLRKVGGVRSVSVSTRDSLASLTAKDDQSIAVKEIPRAVEKAGFTPGTIRIEAVGVAAKDEQGQWVLQVAGTNETLFLVNLPDGAEDQLRALDRGAQVRVEGPVHEHVDTHPALTPETLEEFSP